MAVKEPKADHIPLWRLELLREQQQRKVRRLHAEYMEAQLQLEEMERLITLKKENPND